MREITGDEDFVIPELEFHKRFRSLAPLIFGILTCVDETHWGWLSSAFRLRYAAYRSRTGKVSDGSCWLELISGGSVDLAEFGVARHGCVCCTHHGRVHI